MKAQDRVFQNVNLLPEDAQKQVIALREQRKPFDSKAKDARCHNVAAKEAARIKAAEFTRQIVALFKEHAAAPPAESKRGAGAPKRCAEGKRRKIDAGAQPWSWRSQFRFPRMHKLDQMLSERVKRVKNHEANGAGDFGKIIVRENCRLFQDIVKTAPSTWKFKYIKLEKGVCRKILDVDHDSRAVRPARIIINGLPKEVRPACISINLYGLPGCPLSDKVMKIHPRHLDKFDIEYPKLNWEGQVKLLKDKKDLQTTLVGAQADIQRQLAELNQHANIHASVASAIPPLADWTSRQTCIRRR